MKSLLHTLDHWMVGRDSIKENVTGLRERDGLVEVEEWARLRRLWPLQDADRRECIWKVEEHCKV